MDWKNIIKHVSENASIYGLIPGLPLLYLSTMDFYKAFTEPKQEILIPAFEGIGYLYTHGISTVLLTISNRLRYTKEELIKIKETKQKIKIPKEPEKEKIKVIIKPKDFIHASLHSGLLARKKHEEYGRKNKDPKWLIYAATEYLNLKEYDDSLLCIRDAMDLFEGKQPDLDFLLKKGFITNLTTKFFQSSKPDDPFV